MKSKITADPTIKDVLTAVDNLTESTDTRIKDVLTAVENLAESTAAGFAYSQNRFDQIDQRFESIDKRFESIDQRFESIDQRFESINQRFESINQHFESIEKDIYFLKNQLDSLSSVVALGFSEIKAEIARLDERIDRLLKVTRDDTSVLIDEMDKIKVRVKKLELKNCRA